jgi:hypothetical protein
MSCAVSVAAVAAKPIDFVDLLRELLQLRVQLRMAQNRNGPDLRYIKHA